MKKLNLLRKTIKRDDRLTSYRMDLEIISSENITKDVFVKQRVRNLAGKFDDTFVAIATPVQIEDFDVNSPAEGSSYFRTSAITLIASNPDTIEEIFADILNELQHLAIDAEVLDSLEVDGLYSITADEIETNMAIQHTHYRLPLTAAPAGLNDVYTDLNDSLQKHRILSQDLELPGWIAVTSGDPSNTYFKYNLAGDSTLAMLLPIPQNLSAYAHLEVNGVTTNLALINENGIFWKSNKLGLVPWPVDYVNSGNTGSPDNAVTLVFDIIR